MLPSSSAAEWQTNLGIIGPGNIFYVNSSTGSDSNNGTTPALATATIDAAINLCTASHGDVIYVYPGYTQTITGATGIIPDTAGVTIIGLGEGADRPTITYGTNTTANIPISGASTKIKNMVLLCNVASCVAAVTISASDVVLEDIEIRDQSGKEFVTPILTTNAGDRLKLTRIFHNGQVGGSQCTEGLSLIGVDSCDITDCKLMGKYSTACVNMLTTACTKVVIRNATFQNGTDKTLTKLVKDTQGSSTWCLASGYDVVSGREVAGSNAQTVSPIGDEWRYATASSTSPLTAATLWTYTGTIEAQIVGRVTTAIQAQATTVKLQVTSDALSAADLCTTKDVNAFAAGSLLTIPGAVASAMIGTTGVANAVSQITPSVMTCVTSGTIQPVFGAASTGAITWEMRWRPISKGASVV